MVWRGSNYLSGLILKSYCLYITHLMDELKLLTPWCCFFKCLHLPSYHHQSCDNRRGVFFWVALFSGCEIWPLPTPWKIDDPRGNVHIVIQCTITVIFLNSIFKPKWLEHYYNHLEWPTVWMWSQSYALTGALVCELQFMHSLSQSVNTDTELRQDVPGPLMSLINCSVCQKTDQS